MISTLTKKIGKEISGHLLDTSILVNGFAFIFAKMKFN